MGRCYHLPMHHHDTYDWRGTISYSASPFFVYILTIEEEYVMNKYTMKQARIDYEQERLAAEREAQDYYCALGAYFHWKVDAIYEDAIIDVIGKRGFNLIREFHLMEPCGKINDRKLYAL